MKRRIRVELDREEDGRWIAEVPLLPGVMCYGSTRQEALANVKALTLHTLADRIQHNEEVPGGVDELFTPKVVAA